MSSRKGSRFAFSFSAALLLATGCATSGSKNIVSAPAGLAGGGASSPSRPVENPDEIIVNGVKLENTQFDYPITVNARVEYWVDYFTGRGRRHFEKYLERSELFVPFIRPLLKQNGMPEDLVYLAMIESGFNNHARSSAKAVGPWQFISATGKRYGLMVNWWVDERRDTRKSTLSAVQYLRDLYGMFQSWELAAAAYNAGEAKVARAIRRYHTQDFWAIARQRFLRPETRDYVPKIIAAALVAKNRTQFGFAASPAPAAHDGEAVAPDGEVVKLEKETPESRVAAARDAIESVVTSPEAYENASEEEVHADLAPASMTVANTELDNESSAPVALAKPIPTPHVNKKGELSGESLMDFEVQSPADLLKISRAAGLAYHTVKSLNPEILRWCTPPNVGSYRVKLPMSVKDKFLAAYNSPDFQKKVEFQVYKARKGQSLASVAKHFGLRVDPIADLNGMSAKSMLRAGMLVRLPMPNDGERSFAALEIRDPPEKKKGSTRRRGKRVARRDTAKISFEQRASARAASSIE